jgi:hypothetical protein
VALPIIMIKGSYDYERKYPWSEAAKGLFRVANVPVVAVPAA